MKKRVSMALAALLCVAFLAACGNAASSAATSSAAASPSAAQSSAPALTAEEKEEFFADATAVLDLMHARNYDAIVGLFRPDLAQGVTTETLAAQLDPLLDEAGAFERYGDHDAAAAADPTLGNVVGVFVQCVYANGTITWQVGYDADGNLIAILNMGS